VTNKLTTIFKSYRVILNIKTKKESIIPTKHEKKYYGSLCKCLKGLIKTILLL